MELLRSLLPPGMSIELIIFIATQAIAAVGAYIAIRERLVKIETNQTNHSELLKDSREQIREARKDIDGIAGVIGTVRSKSRTNTLYD